MQVICRPFEEGKCFAIAKKIEEHFTSQRKHPEQWGADEGKRPRWGWVDIFDGIEGK